MIQKGNGTELKGNAIENRGNTTENIAIIRLPLAIFPPISSLKGNTFRATHAGRMLS